LWKSVEHFSKHAVTDTCPVYSTRETVDFLALLGRCERFTSFLIMNILKKLLSSTETIAKLVEKSV
jgi:hypothetical protein